MKQLLAIILAGVTLASQAQESRHWPPRPPMPPRPPIIIVPPRPQEPGKPMELRKMDVRARIVGLHVEATTTMTFFNPNQRQLEGELQFPLPDGAVVTGYALDINGQMVDGVIVKKEKARVAFETEVRRGVDPGIVEHVVGNVYRTRIYPLPAQGTRKIRLKYVSDLPADKNGDAAWFCPMPIGETVSKLAIRVEVSQGVVKPEIGGFGNLRFQSFDNLWVAETEVRDAKPGEDLWVALPKLPLQVTALERTADGDVYFAISDLYVAAAKSAKPPRKLGIAWDASGSRAGEHLQKEIAALKQLGVEFSVLIFRDRPEEIRPLADPDTLKDVAYDGGTDLAAAAEAIKKSDIDRWLLFTDGFDTLSDKLPDFGGKNVTVVVSQSVAHRELLRQVCGHVVDLQRLDAAAILAPATRLLRVHGTGIAEVQGIGLSADGRVSIHGKLTADSAELVLEYSDGHKSPPVKLSKKTATDGTLIASVWAAKRVNQLAVRAEANEDELLTLGRRFGIVSPATSLIVLENLDQYVRNDIEPLTSLPDLLRQWRDRKATMAKEDQQKRASKIDRVLAMWKERVAWWENTYKVEKNFRWKGEPGNHPDSPVAAGDVTTGHTSLGTFVNGGAVAPVEQARQRQMYGRADRLNDNTTMAPASPAPHRTAASMSTALGMLATDAEGLKRSDESGRSEATISVKAWDPSTPYLSALKAAAKADRYKVYLEQRKKFAASPAFFVDCAEFFLREGDNLIGIRVLTNLAELKLEEASLLRVLAWRLQQAGELDRAIVVFRKVQKLRPEEPQSYRDLALALVERGKTSPNSRDITEAMKLFEKVVMGEWDNRFPEVEVIALEELNALMAWVNQQPSSGEWAMPALDARLIKNLDVDVRIVMAWDADATDVDMHVVEPSGEEAAYNHNRTTIGGIVSKDFTQGYGPEEYMVHRAMPGPFKIFAHYYGSRQQTVIGPCTITAIVFTDFGRPTQKKQVLTLRLDKPHEKADIGEIQVGGGKPVPVIKEGKRGDGPQPLARDVFRAIHVGQRAEEVKRLVGEPQTKQGMLWIYRSNDRHYQILMSDTDRVRSVTEILPGGAEMILAQ